MAGLLKRVGSINKIIALAFYYGLFRYFPVSGSFFGGKFSKWLRSGCGKAIFQHCGRNVNVERKAFFGNGSKISIGDNSGIGINCVIPPDTIIGSNVMMGPNVYILGLNHQFDRTDIPMCQQGNTISKQTIIEDDVWIGRQVIFTPGRTVKRGTIIAAGSVLTKDFPEYSIVGGNPAKLIRSRLNDEAAK